MKLNPDCIRDILLAAEEQPYQQPLPAKDLCEKLPNYTEEEIEYTCLKLEEAGYLELQVFRFDNGVILHSIDDISFAGHQFLADIREEPIWKTTKAVAKKTGASSLSAITQIACGVISAIIQQELALNGISL